MLILGIETSCDETSASVVENGRRVLSNIIASQIDLHALTGGVVPEVASREHVVKIIPVIDEALKQAGCVLTDIDAVAVTHGPGLIGCLLVGVHTAQILAITQNLPLIPVNHIVGHLSSTWLAHEERIRFPIVTLTASGGHNELVLIRNHYDFEVLGETLDDAAGEAYDKGARILGLSYPGGPAIAKAALHGNPHRYHLPRAWLETHKNPKNWKNFNFSFSGLKTALLRLAAQEFSREKSDREKIVADLAASYQEAINEVLATKLLLAAQKFQAREIHLVGGVSANQDLRQKIQSALNMRRSSLRFRFPQNLTFCTDNAAMIAAAGFFKYSLNSRKFHHYDIEVSTENSHC